MSGKRTDYISWDEYFMGVAHLVWNALSRTRIHRWEPALSVRSNKILSMGYNGFPTGCSDDDFPWAREGEPLENKYFYTTHSELNAILNYRGRKSLRARPCMSRCFRATSVPRQSSRQESSGWFTTATNITGRRQPSRRGRCFLPQGWIYRNTNIPAGSCHDPSCRKRAFGAARDGGSFLCQ